MSKITCDVITDLLELYADDVVSDDSKALVAEHLTKCADCAGKLETIKQNLNIPIDTGTEPIKRVKRAIKKKKVIISIVSVSVAAALLIGAFIFVTQYKLAIPYEKTHIYEVGQDDNDWELHISYMDNIDSYVLISTLIDETTMEYYICFVDTYFTRYFSNRVSVNSYISIPAYEEMRLPMYNGEFVFPDKYEPEMELTPSDEMFKVRTVRVYYSTFTGSFDGGFNADAKHLIWEASEDEH